MRRRVTVLGLCVCVCCLSVRHHQSCHYAQLSVQPKVATVSLQSGKHWSFLKKCFVQKLWREKANKLISTCTCMCLPRHHTCMAPIERHFTRYFKDRAGLFWFFQSLTAGYMLSGIVRLRATCLSAVQLVQGFCSSTYFLLHVR